MTSQPVNEPIDNHMRRIDAAMSLAIDVHNCEHCEPRTEVIAMRGSLPIAYGVTHQFGCPGSLPDWPVASHDSNTDEVEVWGLDPATKHPVLIRGSRDQC